MTVLKAFHGCAHELVVVVIGASLVAVLPTAHGQNSHESGFPAGIRLLSQVNGETAITRLGNRLPEVAAFYGQSPEQLRPPMRADPSLWVDRSGELFFVCGLQAAEGSEVPASETAVIAESIGPTDPPPFDTSEAFSLHSRPGANRVIYLDFDGHADTTGRWKAGAASPPYDIDGDTSTFSATERNRIIYIWQRVSEDYSMYDIDVTTEQPDIEALRKVGGSDSAYGIRIVIGGAGGVAFVGSFDSNQDVPGWVFSQSLGNTEKVVAEAASHEAGHTLGLLHDGIEGGAGYYSGQGNWAPIMGASYSKTISQWSKGEYANANNTQDDLAVMLTQGAVYRPDDHGNATTNATELSTDTDTASVSGVIERTTDLDFFRIDAAGGSLVIDATPATHGPNLRLEVKLYDAAGAVLQTATSADTSAGTQPVMLTRSVGAGVHYISVDGVGNGDPATTGYSDYASLGQYSVTITGVISGGFTWLPVAAGTFQWSSMSNWASGNLPNGAGSSVRINSDITGNQTIQFAGATSIGRLFLGDSNSTHAFTFASSGGSIVFDNSGGPAFLSKTVGAHDVITAPVSLSSELVVNQSASGRLGFSGGISGSGAMTKTGAGTVVFGSANSYTGITTLRDGLLRLDVDNGLPGGIDNAVGAGESALAFDGGVLGLWGDFTRQLGAGAGQLDWNPGSGGFAAFGADCAVRLNNGTGALSWSSAIIGGGNILILGHPTATHTLNFRNGISFAGSKRTVQVEDGEADIDANLSGSLSGGGSSGLYKTGSGTLALSNANSYVGTTTIDGGVLRLEDAGALPSGNLELTGGGILGLGAGDLTDRTIGPGLDQVQWTGEGGFAAFGGARAVKFSDSSINWSAANFIGGGRALLLSHDTADAALDWQQRISLAGSTRIIQVDDGTAVIDAKMSGIIAGGLSGTNNVFNKTGAGTLALTAQNSYWGNTIVSLGTLMIGDGGTTGGVSQNSPSIFVDADATLAVNRSNTLTQGTNPLNAPITGDGGFAQVGTGNTVLTLANSYLGPTTLNAGTLSLGASDVLPDTSAVLIGTATLDAGSFTETAGTLDITGAATIQLGSGAAIAFADSSAVDWAGGTLQIAGTFVSGSSLRFGTTSSGLTPAQLALISADGFANFALDSSGYLTADAVIAFASWITGAFANGTIPIDKRGPNDDFDNDGKRNLMEFAIEGCDPTVAEASVGTFTGGTLSFAKRAGTSGLIYAIEDSSDLGISDPWEEVTGGSYVNSAATISYDLPTGPSRMFLRLRVSSQ